MAKPKLIIGGNHIPDDNIEAQIENLKSNRAIIAVPLNDDAGDEPALNQCETIEQVFKTYKPDTEVSVKDEEGASEDVKIRFNKVKDFDLESVVDAVPKMRDQKEALLIMKDLKNQLKENVKLRRAVDDPDQRQKLIASLREALKVLQGS